MMMSNEDLILSQLMELNEKVGGIQSELNASQQALKVHQESETLILNDIKEHVQTTNGRVTALEISKWKITGVVSFVTFLLTVAGAWFGFHK